MSRQKSWAYMHTEEYIKEIESDEQEWYQKNKESEKWYQKELEQRLKAGTEEDRKKLLEMFGDETFIETYKSRNDLAYMIVVMQTYEREIKSGEIRTILDMGKSIQELKAKLLQLKFILWRMEFAEDIQAERQLIDFVQINQVSPDMIQHMVHTSLSSKAKLLMKLADLFLEQKMLRYAFRMLEYLDELYAGNEEVLCMLAELCGYAGNRQRAGEYLDKIKNPGKLAEGIRRKYEC